MIFVIASIGTDNIAPGTPQIQNQKTSDPIIRRPHSLVQVADLLIEHELARKNPGDGSWRRRGQEAIGGV